MMIRAQRTVIFPVRTIDLHGVRKKITGDATANTRAIK